jgi:hypothetical protein
MDIPEAVRRSLSPARVLVLGKLVDQLCPDDISLSCDCDQNSQGMCVSEDGDGCTALREARDDAQRFARDMGRLMLCVQRDAPTGMGPGAAKLCMQLLPLSIDVAVGQDRTLAVWMVDEVLGYLLVHHAGDFVDALEDDMRDYPGEVLPITQLIWCAAERHPLRLTDICLGMLSKVADEEVRTRLQRCLVRNFLLVAAIHALFSTCSPWAALCSSWKVSRTLLTAPTPISKWVLDGAVMDAEAAEAARMGIGRPGSPSLMPCHLGPLKAELREQFQWLAKAGAMGPCTIGDDTMYANFAAFLDDCARGPARGGASAHGGGN